jgi:4-oxalomesaconate hydratase
MAHFLGFLVSVAVAPVTTRPIVNGFQPVYLAPVSESVLVVSAHAADFVWRAGGAIALYASRGHPVTVVCLSYGEKGESARYWREGLSLDEVKAARHEEASNAAAVLGADLVTYDAGDYPLIETPELRDRLAHLYRELEPALVLTHTTSDPWNFDHPTAARLAMEARIVAQAPGFDAVGEPLGAPPVFMFEPHQSEYCDFMPNVLLDITEVWDKKRAAMECMIGQDHLWEYYTEVAKRRGSQARRNSGPNLGLDPETMGEAYQRVYPQVASELS